MIIAEQIIETARTQIGVAFRHQGRCSGVGLDCIGLLVHVARELGVPHQDCATYRRRATAENLRAGLAGSGLLEIDLGDLSIGDVALFWIRKPDRPQHVGLITDRGLLHTYADVGKVVEHTLGDWWQRRICGAWRFPGVGAN